MLNLAPSEEHASQVHYPGEIIGCYVLVDQELEVANEISCNSSLADHIYIDHAFI